MATYEQIQNWVKANFGWKGKTCWIAHCKEIEGIPIKPAHNRSTNGRANPCPDNKRGPIFAAFTHFEMA